MRIISATDPGVPFLVDRYDVTGKMCELRFYENVAATTVEGEDGESHAAFEMDLYKVKHPYFPGIEEAIAANMEVWLQQAKQAELRGNIDPVQDRADIDFLLALNGLN